MLVDISMRSFVYEVTILWPFLFQLVRKPYILVGFIASIRAKKQASQEGKHSEHDRQLFECWVG